VKKGLTCGIILLDWWNEIKKLFRLDSCGTLYRDSNRFSFESFGIYCVADDLGGIKIFGELICILT